MSEIVELPADEPFPASVAPALELDLDLAAWAARRRFAGIREWVDGLGPAFVVELSVHGEVLLLQALENHPQPGRVVVEVRGDRADREAHAVELARAIGLSGPCRGTETGTAYVL